MLHYSTDVPLAIKSLLYIPTSHSEKNGLMQEQPEVHLYSKKVLIKEKCQELLPHYLRFIKGVVDCEDLPLNISRENYQDSSLISKLRNVITRRLIKHIDDESKRDPEKYKKWFQDFGNFIKEGITVDSENKDALFRLLRFTTRNGGSQELVAIDDYISKMKEGQEKVYFVVNPNFEQALRSPYMEPFKNNKDLDVLILTLQVDELLLQQMGDYKGKKFVSIESAYEEIQKDLGKNVELEAQSRSRIPEDDITGFCLWLKNDLSDSIGKVSISKRLRDTPALITGQMSSSMRMMMQMMEGSGQMPGGMDMSRLAKDNTLELNAAHPIVVNLNQLRKTNKEAASLVARQLLDNVMVQSGIPFNMQDGTDRQYKLLNSYLELMVEKDPVHATRKEISLDESVLKQAQDIK